MTFNQHGGACSLCGAQGANKTTCPLNPKVKNPNLAKHRKDNANSSLVKVFWELYDDEEGGPKGILELNVDSNTAAQALDMLYWYFNRDASAETMSFSAHSNGQPIDYIGTASKELPNLTLDIHDYIQAKDVYTDKRVNKTARIFAQIHNTIKRESAKYYQSH